jgi:phosphatidylserine decarboxylase
MKFIIAWYINMAPDGIKVIIITTVLLFVFIITWYLYPVLPVKILTILVAIVFIFNFFFFRDPDRIIPPGENIIVAPADGKIIKIEEVEEPYYFKEKVRCVSIFLSVFNVHVNRIPTDGVVSFLKYNKGKFLPAFADKASIDNEQSIIGIQHAKGKILFKQIAGIIARRVVYHLNENDQVNRGERFGLIRYGSRVDIFIPKNVILRVKLRDTVLAGETIIGEFE